ncbi:hypothetical protein GCM10009069_29320 [Algimonas arctica]|uniref:CBS domain-containing protein n=2 Tax=Algimonas arctica TaxID=1479486 RepID=A0A8J3CUD5_9PROT|nr:CBS domain-containing protein [Algimonas arctica]GHB04914.1 hypothetical protein GCM10009069_29320 [Algimonas arctica]
MPSRIKSIELEEDQKRMKKANPRPGNRLMDRPEYASKLTPLTFTESTTVLDAAAAMTKKNYGSVIVVDDDNRVIGVVTERDVMNKLVVSGLDAETTALSAIMTENPRTAKETDDLIDWLRIMSNERFRRLPVVDDQGRIKAVFTQGDFVSYTWPDLLYQMRSIATATITKNFGVFLIAGGIALYTVIVLLAVGFFT